MTSPGPGAALFTEESVFVQYSRQDVVDVLEKAGLPDAADEATAELPDPVDVTVVEDWALRHGITRDVLISQLGGSP